jgi:hypothetical protein
MIVLAAPAVVCIVGALMYALAANPKLVRMGEIAFAVGLFWLVYFISAHGRAMLSL